MASKKKASRKAGPKARQLTYAVWNKVFIRTVTSFYTGQIVGVDEHCVHLVDAAWIAETGRFADAMARGFEGLSPAPEIEPYPDGRVVSVSRGAIVSACEWPHPLPRVQR